MTETIRTVIQPSLVLNASKGIGAGRSILEEGLP